MDKHDIERLMEVSDEEAEILIRPFLNTIESFQEQFGYPMETIFKALFVCHGDVPDTKAFILGQFDQMKQPPIPKDELQSA